MNTQFTAKMFILLHKKDDIITKYPKEDDKHLDIHEIITLMHELGDAEFCIRRLNYIDVEPDEFEEYIRGINDIPSGLVTLN